MSYYDLFILILGVFIIGVTFIRKKDKTFRSRLLFALALPIFITLFFFTHHQITGTCKLLASGDVDQVLAFIQSSGAAAPLVSIFLMILQSVIAPLPAFLITAANGILFGFFWGLVISLVGALGGAIVSFAISRWVYTNFAIKQLTGTKVESYIHKISSKYGFKIILIARLLPIVSFDLISYAAGLSTIKMREFLLATFLGMFPATVVYTAIGSGILTLNEYSEQIIIYSIVASILLIAFWVVQALNSSEDQNE